MRSYGGKSLSTSVRRDVCECGGGGGGGGDNDRVIVVVMGIRNEGRRSKGRRVRQG